jgi:hypothetical protein
MPLNYNSLLAYKVRLEKAYRQLDKRKAKTDAPILVRELIVKQETSGRYGEAREKEPRPNSVERLIAHIQDLANIANAYHQQSYCETTGDGHYSLKAIHSNSITRISLQEFSLYTKTPLSLAEFEKIIEAIRMIASRMHNNVHLLLSSFNLVTKDGTILNLTLYVECNQEPIIRPITKASASKVDIHVGEKTLFSQQESNDKQWTHASSFSGATTGENVSNDSVFEVCTAGGAHFTLAIDVCLDHFHHHSMLLLKSRLKNLDSDNIFLSAHADHVVTSNSISLIDQAQITPVTLHVDPNYSSASIELDNTELNSEALQALGMSELAVTVAPGVLTVKNPQFGAACTVKVYKERSLGEYASTIQPLVDQTNLRSKEALVHKVAMGDREDLLSLSSILPLIWHDKMSITLMDPLLFEVVHYTEAWNALLNDPSALELTQQLREHADKEDMDEVALFLKKYDCLMELKKAFPDAELSELALLYWLQNDSKEYTKEKLNSFLAALENKGISIKRLDIRLLSKERISDLLDNLKNEKVIKHLRVDSKQLTDSQKQFLGERTRATYLIVEGCDDIPEIFTYSTINVLYKEYLTTKNPAALDITNKLDTPQKRALFLKEISIPTYFNKIGKLILSGNPIIITEIAPLFNELKFNSSITELDLSNTQLQEDSIAHFAEAIRWTKELHRIELKGNTISRKNADALMEAVKLNPTIWVITGCEDYPDLEILALINHLAALKRLKSADAADTFAKLLNYLKDTKLTTINMCHVEFNQEEKDAIAKVVLENQSINSLHGLALDGETNKTLSIRRFAVQPSQNDFLSLMDAVSDQEKLAALKQLPSNSAKTFNFSRDEITRMLGNIKDDKTLLLFLTTFKERIIDVMSLPSHFISIGKKIPKESYPSFLTAINLPNRWIKGWTDFIAICEQLIENDPDKLNMFLEQCPALPNSFISSVYALVYVFKDKIIENEVIKTYFKKNISGLIHSLKNYAIVTESLSGNNKSLFEAIAKTAPVSKQEKTGFQTTLQQSIAAVQGGYLGNKQHKMGLLGELTKAIDEFSSFEKLEAAAKEYITLICTPRKTIWQAAFGETRSAKAFFADKSVGTAEIKYFLKLPENPAEAIKIIQSWGLYSSSADKLEKASTFFSHKQVNGPLVTDDLAFIYKA